MRAIWVDPQTLGARLTYTTELVLTRASGPALPTDVYAFRNDDSRVVLYVATPENATFETRQWEYAFARKERADLWWGQPNCGHMVFSLKPQIGGGWTAPIYVRRAKSEGSTEVMEITARRVGYAFYVRARLQRL